MTHTPGPWSASEPADGVMTRIYQAKDRNFTIAHVLRDAINVHQQANDDCNVRLIAAAPELLEALEELYAFSRGNLPVDVRESDLATEIHALARAAISKAVGKGVRA